MGQFRRKEPTPGLEPGTPSLRVMGNVVSQLDQDVRKTAASQKRVRDQEE
jgi:hypothetical protein